MPGRYVKGSRPGRGPHTTCDYDSPVSSGPVRHRALRTTFTAIVIRAFCLRRPRRCVPAAGSRRAAKHVN